MGRYLFPELFEPIDNLRMHLLEGFPGGLGGGIQDGTVGQDYAGAQEHLVRIGVRAAAHAGSVVGHNTAHHATADGGRIRSEVPAVGCQVLIHPCPHDSGLQRHGGVIVIFPFLPMFAGHHKDAVRDGLPGKGGSGSPESHREAHFVCQSQNPGHFVFIGRPQDHLGLELVLAGIGPPGEGAKFVRIDAVLGQDALYSFQKCFHFSNFAN